MDFGKISPKDARIMKYLMRKYKKECQDMSPDMEIPEPVEMEEGECTPSTSYTSLSHINTDMAAGQSHNTTYVDSDADIAFVGPAQDSPLDLSNSNFELLQDMYDLNICPHVENMDNNINNSSDKDVVPPTPKDQRPPRGRKRPGPMPTKPKPQPTAETQVSETISDLLLKSFQGPSVNRTQSEEGLRVSTPTSYKDFVPNKAHTSSRVIRPNDSDSFNSINESLTNVFNRVAKLTLAPDRYEVPASAKPSVKKVAFADAVRSTNYQIPSTHHIPSAENVQNVSLKILQEAGVYKSRPKVSLKQSVVVKPQSSTSSNYQQRVDVQVLPDALPVWRELRTSKDKVIVYKLRASYYETLLDKNYYPDWSVNFHPPKSLITTQSAAEDIVKTRREMSRICLSMSAQLRYKEISRLEHKIRASMASLEVLYSQRDDYKLEDALQGIERLNERARSLEKEKLDSNYLHLVQFPESALWQGMPEIIRIPDNTLAPAVPQQQEQVLPQRGRDRSRPPRDQRMKKASRRQGSVKKRKLTPKPQQRGRATQQKTINQIMLMLKDMQN
jgi:hypothetical protein